MSIDLLPSSPTYSEASQILSGLNAVIQAVNDALPGGGQNLGEALYLPSVTTAINLLSITPSASTDPVILAVGGPSNVSTTIDFAINVQSGRLKLLGGGAFATNGTVAVTTSAVGPTGASTIVRQWMVVKHSNGSIYYIPAY